MAKSYRVAKTDQGVSKKRSKIAQIVAKQHKFLARGTTRDYAFRIAQLKRLRSLLKAHEEEIMAALNEDLGKPSLEGYIAEIAFLYQEIDHTIKHLKKWMKPEKVKTPLLYQRASSWVVSEPYGVVLIIGPWNYPLQLVFAPLIAALAAGNTAVIKPSRLAPQTGKVMAKIISIAFESNYVTLLSGAAKGTKEILNEKFDYIFFTGGVAVGKIVMEAAAKHLTPVTLELGGKSPVIVHKDTNLLRAAKRILWGKFINAGQTCLAPDYLLVHESVKDELLNVMKETLKEFYGEDPHRSKSYGRIINRDHFERIENLMKGGTIIVGGEKNKSNNYIAPTIIDDISLKDPIMGEEIFGPLLPVMTYKNFDDISSTVHSLPKPLALYLFTDDKMLRKRVLDEISSGGVVINDTVIHVANYNLPFGGVGDSGIGVYHGRHGFDALSHKKAVMRKKFSFDIPYRYPPYDKGLAFMRKFFSNGILYRIIRKLVM